MPYIPSRVICKNYVPTLGLLNRTGSWALLVWLSWVVQQMEWEEPQATRLTLTPSSPCTRAGFRLTLVPPLPCWPWSLSPQANTWIDRYIDNV